MVLVTTVYRDMTREELNEISHSQAVRDLAVGRTGLWGAHCEHRRGPGLSILPHSSRFLPLSPTVRGFCHRNRDS